MSPPTGKRNSDRMNIIGVVTVGICGAVLTYVSIILLEAFYMNETSQIERQRAFESPQSLRSTVKSATLTNLDGVKEGTIKIDEAMKIVVAEAAKDPSNLVPAVGPSRKPTVKAQYGRPGPIETKAEPAPPVTPDTAPADSAAPTTTQGGNAK